MLDTDQFIVVSDTVPLGAQDAALVLRTNEDGKNFIQIYTAGGPLDGAVPVTMKLGVALGLRLQADNDYANHMIDEFDTYMAVLREAFVGSATDGDPAGEA